MVKGCRNFSREFKLEAVALVTKAGLCVAHHSWGLGINESALSRLGLRRQADTCRVEVREN